MMRTLDFRNAGLPIRLDALLRRALPALAPESRASLLQEAEVRVGSRRGAKPSMQVDPGERVLIRARPGAASWPEALASAADVPLLRFSAADRISLDAALRSGRLELSARALAPALPWPEGELAAQGKGPRPELFFQRMGEWEGVAELEIHACGFDLDALCAKLAALGAPVLGDIQYGGRLVQGGLRLQIDEVLIREVQQLQHVDPIEQKEIRRLCGLFGGEELALAWPSEPVFPAEGGALQISRATARALADGHPWILRDEDTGDVERYRPGARVEVCVKGSTSPVGEVLIEGSGRVAARLWRRSTSAGRGEESPEARVARALARRAELFASESGPRPTTAFRLVHGEADGLPGFFADRLGPVLRVINASRACEGFRERAIEALCYGLEKRLGAAPAVVEVVHLHQVPSGRFRSVRLLRGELPADLLDGSGRFSVREEGLRFLVDPGLGEPFRPRPGVGLFMDQRENRHRVAAIAAKEGGRWLNLFAHTGAFSACLLAAGAEEVCSVDLSAPYLRWLEENLILNELPLERHRSIRGDGRRILKRLCSESRFRGIVIDPPTAASAGRKFWSVRAEGAELLGAALEGLEPGGRVLLCRNDRGAQRKLRKWVHACAEDRGIQLANMVDAPPSPDFPRLPSFPESSSFAGVLLTRC